MGVDRYRAARRGGRYGVSSREIVAAVSSDLSPEARRAEIVKLARQGLKESQDTNRQAMGYLPPHETFVDGRRGAAEESVNIDRGSIVYAFDLMSSLLEWIDANLILNSPYRSGRYQRSHLLMADGDPTDPHNPAPADTYTFVNVQPYARKIEAAQAVYEGVAALASHRFGNIAAIRFSYASALIGAVNEWADKTSMSRGGKRMSAAQRRDWLTRNPAIVVRIR